MKMTNEEKAEAIVSSSAWDGVGTTEELLDIVSGDVELDDLYYEALNCSNEDRDEDGYLCR